MVEPGNMPMPGTPVPSGSSGAPKPIVLHLGDPIKHHTSLYTTTFASSFTVIRPPAEERQRPAFLAALRAHRWGDFAAVLRPHWLTGGEMGAWDAELIPLLPASCLVVASAGAGYDWADVALLGRRGIVYCNGSPAVADSVADFAVAMVISTFRSLPLCAAAGASGDPEVFAACHRTVPARNRGLRGQALGIVGMGAIGRRVAERCRFGFGMEILYHAPARKPEVEEKGVEARYCASFRELCAESDCVVLCAPASAGCLVNAEGLAWFRPGARLVNVGRGSLVDEAAVADSLERNVATTNTDGDGEDQGLSAVALDVFADEPRVHPHLVALAAQGGPGRALLTCHNAGATRETHAGFEELAMRNVMAVLGGREALTPVNLAFWERGAG